MAGRLPIRGAASHNHKSVDDDIRLGILAVVTGVSGSGKSPLSHGHPPGHADAIVADQSPIRSSRRSNPAACTGLLDAIRTAFAKENSVKASLFSANSDGACPSCKGAGLIYTDPVMMAGAPTVCEVSEGKRFKAGVFPAQARTSPRCWP